MSLLEEITVTPALWQPIIELVASVEDITQCLYVFDQMRSSLQSSSTTCSTPTPQQWDIVLRCALKSRKPRHILKAVDIMSRVDKMSLSRELLLEILRAFASKNDHEGVMKFLDLVSPNKLTAKVLSTLKDMTEYQQIRESLRGRSLDSDSSHSNV